MKHLLALSILFIALTGCMDDKRSNYTTVDEDGNLTMTDESIEIITDLMNDFIACKKSEPSLINCKHHIARAACEFYQEEDLKENGEYVPYDKIKEFVTTPMNDWEYLGEATSNKALEKAQAAANNGQITLAISFNNSYGHVAIILPGSVEKAPSWNNLKAPTCASFFMVASMEPFVNKSLAHAWSSPENIKLYTKEN